MSYKCRLVSLATMWNWGQIGTIRFNQYPVQWDRFRDVSQHPGVLKRQNAGEGQIESEIQRIFREPGVSGKAVKDTAYLC